MKGTMKKSNKEVKLNLGCGDKRLEGWINTDRVYIKGIVDKVLDIRDLNEFEDLSVDVIYASHVIEHIHYSEILNTLAEWHRVLKINGKVMISTPDLFMWAKKYIEGNDDWWNRYGVQEAIIQTSAYRFVEHLYALGGGIHKCAFDEGLLTTYLKLAGFFDVKKFEPFVNDVSSLEWSLNLEAIKKIGNFPSEHVL